MKPESSMFLLAGGTILPECVLILGLLIILIIDLASTKKETTVLYITSLTTLLGTIAILSSRWDTESITSFSGSFQIDSFSRIFQIFITLCSIPCIPLSIEYIECTKMPISEFLVFVLTGTVGGMFPCGANDLVTISVSSECLNLCSYSLCGYTKRDIRSNEAAMKYLLTGGIGSSMLVYGFSWLYGLSGGETNIQEIVNGLSNTQMYNSAGVSIALVCVTSGLALKLSMAPFHQWTPDIYEGPTPVVAFLSIISKIAGVALATRILNISFVSSANEWKLILEVLAISSMILGNLVAITQTSMKRMLAYSSISQVGYIIIGVITGNLSGYTSMCIYILFYIFMNLGTFACVISFGSRTGTDNIRDYAGLYAKDPLLGFSSTSCSLSLGGIPPLTGFFGKLYLFWCGWQAGFYLLVSIALITSVISIYYYLKIIRLIIYPRNNERVNYYIRTYIVPPVASSATKNSIKVSILVCAMGSILLGSPTNPMFSLIEDTLRSSIFVLPFLEFLGISTRNGWWGDS